MATASLIQMLVLEEFRLRAADLAGAAARIVARSPHGIEQGIPLLTSIDDRRDVATLRGVHAGESLATDSAQHAALDSLVLRWTEPKHYGPRITERSQTPPSTAWKSLCSRMVGTNRDAAAASVWPSSASAWPRRPCPSGRGRAAARPRAGERDHEPEPENGRTGDGNVIRRRGTKSDRAPATTTMREQSPTTPSVGRFRSVVTSACGFTKAAGRKIQQQWPKARGRHRAHGGPRRRSACSWSLAISRSRTRST